MTKEDWDEIFADMVMEAKALLDKGEERVSLDYIEGTSMVGFYDLRALCRERPAALRKAGLAFSDDHLYYEVATAAPVVEQEPPVPTVVGVDGQVVIAYTSK